MNRNRAMTMLSLLLATMLVSACSMNRQTPSNLDKAAMEGDIRAAIAEAVPSKTFAVEVDVGDNGYITLSGHVDNDVDRNAIIAKVRQVNGVRQVNASGLHIG